MRIKSFFLPLSYLCFIFYSNELIAQNDVVVTKTAPLYRDSVYHSTRVKPLITGIYLYVPFEYQKADFQSVNEIMEKQNLRFPTQSKLNAGIGIMLNFRRGIVDFSYAGAYRDKDEESYISKSISHSLSANFGYNFLNTNFFWLYPIAGIKICGIEYKYRDKVASDISFDDYLKKNLTYKSLSFSRAYFDLGVGFSYQKTGLIGFRAGYLIPIGKGGWAIDDKIKITDSPTLNYKYYLKVTIGIGSAENYHKNKTK